MTHATHDEDAAVDLLYRQRTNDLLRQTAGDEAADKVAPLDSTWHWRAMNLALGLARGTLTDEMLEKARATGSLAAVDKILASA